MTSFFSQVSLIISLGSWVRPQLKRFSIPVRSIFSYSMSLRAFFDMVVRCWWLLVLWCILLATVGSNDTKDLGFVPVAGAAPDLRQLAERIFPPFRGVAPGVVREPRWIDGSTLANATLWRGAPARYFGGEAGCHLLWLQTFRRIQGAAQHTPWKSLENQTGVGGLRLYYWIILPLHGLGHP